MTGSQAHFPGPRPASSEQIKSCCAAAYSSETVSLLLGESFHPGGPALTRRLADRLTLEPGMRVLDVACGRGTTARLLVKEYGVHVDGVDLSVHNIDEARTVTHREGVGDRVTFHHGDAEKLPFDDAAFDAVICECALCTFPDKPAAAREFARALRPGGRVGISDITTADGGLPDELADLTGWVACLADARPADAYRHLLTQAGLTVEMTEEHDQALAELIEQIQVRLRVLRMATRTTARQPPQSAEPEAPTGLDLQRALALTQAAARAVRDRIAGYCLILARR
jgi:arsenite methyltransferase